MVDMGMCVCVWTVNTCARALCTDQSRRHILAMYVGVDHFCAQQDCSKLKALYPQLHSIHEAVENLFMRMKARVPADAQAPVCWGGGGGAGDVMHFDSRGRHRSPA
jgi:hypothetical protein